MKRRHGFTLVELLVVISIIAILAAVSVRVIVGTIMLGREAATKTTVQKVGRLMQSRHEAFLRQWGGNDVHTIARIHATREWIDAAQFSQNGGSPINANQRLILARKLLYSRAHPQTPADLTGPPWYLPASDVVGLDDSEILYYVLTHRQLVAQNGKPIDRSDVAGPNLTYDSQIDFSADEVRDTDGDGNFEFVDAWGTPIRFWRYSGAIFRADIDGTGTQAIPHEYYSVTILPHIPRPTNRDGTPRFQDYGKYPDQLAHDSDDPLRLMATVDNFATTFHPAATAQYWLVMSAGPDKEFGLAANGDVSTPWDPAAAANPADVIPVNLERRLSPISDNISASLIRAGGL